MQMSIGWSVGLSHSWFFQLISFKTVKLIQIIYYDPNVDDDEENYDDEEDDDDEENDDEEDDDKKMKFFKKSYFSIFLFLPFF